MLDVVSIDLYHWGLRRLHNWALVLSGSQKVREVALLLMEKVVPKLGPNANGRTNGRKSPHHLDI